MRSAALLLCFIACVTACLFAAADLGQVHSVYLLPMANGLDQYLANRITGSGVFQVVTDPSKAEAIFTDKLGEAFEERLNELFPPVAEKRESQAPGGQAEQRMRSSTFGRGKGTIFLVDTASRIVLWSAYEPPKDSTPGQLDRTARRIVERLKTPAKR
jgi:hypothetical protein